MQTRGWPGFLQAAGEAGVHGQATKHEKKNRHLLQMSIFLPFEAISDQKVATTYRRRAANNICAQERLCSAEHVYDTSVLTALSTYVRGTTQRKGRSNDSGLLMCLSDEMRDETYSGGITIEHRCGDKCDQRVQARGSRSTPPLKHMSPTTLSYLTNLTTLQFPRRGASGPRSFQ